MIPVEPPVAREDINIEAATGRGGAQTTNGTLPDEGKSTGIPSQDYSDNLRSRFGEAFLPFATQLENVDKIQVIRKRRGRNKKK